MNLKEMSTSDLTHLEKDIRRELSFRKYHEGYKQGQFDAKMDEIVKPKTLGANHIAAAVAKCTNEYRYRLTKEINDYVPIVSPQQQRDAIVEQAKKDIEDLKERMASSQSNHEGNYTFRECSTKVVFVVNREKRTIVALLKGHLFPERRYEKGIAKCAPTDCFNAHIGKAIAIRRALGLEVPAEYLNAPQPTEVRVGDVVALYRDPSDFVGNYAVSGFDDDGWLEFSEGGCSKYTPNSGDRIIDDTRGVDGE